MITDANTEAITAADLRELVKDLPDDTVVDISVYVQQADRPYESSRTQVTLEVEVDA